MITEDYVSSETAKLLKEKGFYEPCHALYHDGEDKIFFGLDEDSYRNTILNTDCYACPTLQMVIRWMEEEHHILIVPNYIYECTDDSWVYKIYRLEENGKPERCPIKGVSYDKDNNPTEHIVGYRDYYLGHGNYTTRKEAEEEGIKYCLENLI